jgi:Domain of Unknown Function (DUF748)
MFRLLIKAYVAYLGISLLLVLPALNFAIPWFVKQTYGRSLQTEIILFNPFALSVEVRGATLPQPDGETFAGFSLAELNLSLASIWSRGWVFDAVRLEGLYVDVQRQANGNFNFSDLLPAEGNSQPPVPDEQSNIPGVTIHNLFVQAHWLKFTDRGRQKPFSTQYDGLEIAVNDLSTVYEEGKPYTLEVRGEGGGLLRWNGQVSIPGAFSKGALALSNISLKAVSRFLEPWVNFEISDGRLGVQGKYSLSWDNGVQYRVDEGRVKLSKLAVSPLDTVQLPQTGVNLEELLVSDLVLNGDDQSLGIGSVDISGLDVSGWSEGSDVSLATLFTPRAAPQQDDSAAGDGEEGQWTIAIEQTTLGNSAVQWRSEFTDPPTVRISPLDISVMNLNWPPRGETQIALNLMVNNKAQLEMNTALALLTGRGQLNYSLSELPVKWFNPNLPGGVDAAISKGQLEASGAAVLADFAPVQISMDGAVTDFSITVQEAEDAITGWNFVRWKQLDLNLEQKNISLAGLFIDGYSGRLHIFEDGTINTQRALSEEANKIERVAEHTPSEEPEQPWSFSLPTISLTDSKLDFMDESLPIAFRTVIGDLNGDITGITSDPTGDTHIDLTGSVDGYAPVTLNGTAKPFTSPPDLDLALNFDGLDMSRLSPYSGTYAGHAIDRGILNLDLNYKMANAKLEGSNSIIINQLKLGEKIDSDKAVDLPLGLAIALLTDLNGVIDLSVPVSGNVEDPEFNIGGVIFSTLVNIISKAVTAPFNLLAGLVNSEEDLQRVTFPSGSAQLDETAKAKLTDLYNALMQRPELILIISGRLHPRADLVRLQKNTLKAELIALGLTEQDWVDKGDSWSQAINKRYGELNITEAGEQELSALEKYKRVYSTIQISDERLEKLAEDRTVETKRFLVNEAQLPAERAVIEAFDIDDEANLFSGVEMKIDS